MTRWEILRRWPESSECFLKANADPEPSVSDAKPQCDQTPALGATVQGEAESLPRVRVRITGYRCRPLDPDNFAGGCKDCIDGLRHAGLLHGDETWNIILETEQVKVNHKNEQKTVIELFI